MLGIVQRSTTTNKTSLFNIPATIQSSLVWKDLFARIQNALRSQEIFDLPLSGTSPFAILNQHAPNFQVMVAKNTPSEDLR